MRLCCVPRLQDQRHEGTFVIWNSGQPGNFFGLSFSPYEDISTCRFEWGLSKFSQPGIIYALGGNKAFEERYGVNCSWPCGQYLVSEPIKESHSSCGCSKKYKHGPQTPMTGETSSENSLCPSVDPLVAIATAATAPTSGSKPTGPLTAMATVLVSMSALGNAVTGAHGTAVSIS